MSDALGMTFEKLLDPIEGLDNVLKEVESDPRLEQPRLLFLRMRAEEPQLHALAELLTDLLVDYAIPLAKRKRANEAGSASRTGGNTAMHSRLYREAKRLLIEYEKANQGRYGELGELLSYALAVHYLGAAQIGSKMALKTSQGMPDPEGRPKQIYVLTQERAQLLLSTLDISGLVDLVIVDEAQAIGEDTRTLTVL